MAGTTMPPAMRGAQRDQMLLFGVMLAVAIGNTGLQSVLPAIARTIRLPDAFVAVAFSLSALLWSVAAPWWAKRLDERSAKRMVIVGLGGFAGSLLICGIALTAGVLGWVSATVAFILFAVGRCLYGLFGAAAPPAAQALIIADVPRAGRTAALTLLASAFGLGTILGPALAPFFVLPWVGLAGPLYVFAVLGIGMIALIHRYLPVGGRIGAGRGVATADPSIGFEPSDASVFAASIDARTDGSIPAKVRFFDPRIRAWMVIGLVSGHAQAIAGQTLAFLVIDRLASSPIEAQPLIGMVLMCGAGAALLAQWGIIPRLGLEPRAMVLWGSGMAALGMIGTALADDLHTLAIVFAVASLGFGFLRPGFTAGASLAVSEDEQGVVAGQVTSNNGLAFVFGPSIGILLYQIARPLPYLFGAMLLIVLLIYGLRALPKRVV